LKKRLYIWLFGLKNAEKERKKYGSALGDVVGENPHDAAEKHLTNWLPIGTLRKTRFDSIIEQG
jgi:hypothetical protein